MSVEIIQNDLKNVWHELYHNKQLGAGNFLFFAYDLYADKNKQFLFMQTPFKTPSGKLYQSFSLEDLHSAVKEMAYWYKHLVIQADDTIAIFLENPIAPFIHFLALNSIGAVPVLINSNLNLDVLTVFIKDNGFTQIVVDNQTLVSQLSCHLPAVTIFDANQTNQIRHLSLNYDDKWPVDRHGEDSIMICHTSGTTGIPKAVLFTHDQFFYGKRERLRTFVESENEKLLLTIPATHAAGISYLMTAVILQLPIMHVDFRQVKLVEETISKFMPSIMVAFMYTYRYLAKRNLPDHFYHSIKRFYNTGDIAHTTHIRKLLKLAPLATFIDMMGSSELGMAQFYNSHQLGTKAILRSVGKPATYAACAILSQQGNILPANQVGYMGIKSSTITPGYYQKNYLTEINYLYDYWLTGDVGTFNTNGEYIHLDRISDVINPVFSSPVYSLLLEEELLENNQQITDVVVIGAKRGASNEQAVVVLVEAQQHDIAKQILKQILTLQPFVRYSLKLLPYSLAVAIMSPEYQFPTGATGKILKRKLRDEFWHMYQDYYFNQNLNAIKTIQWNHDIDIEG